MKECSNNSCSNTLQIYQQETGMLAAEYSETRAHSGLDGLPWCIGEGKTIKWFGAVSLYYPTLNKISESLKYYLC